MQANTNYFFFLPSLFLLLIFSSQHTLAQTALEIELEKNTHQRYQSPLELKKVYTTLLKKNKHANAQDQQIISLYLYYCNQAIDNKKENSILEEKFTISFDFTKYPFAHCRQLIYNARKKTKAKEFELAAKIFEDCILKARKLSQPLLRTEAYYFFSQSKQSAGQLDSTKLLLEQAMRVAKENKLYAHEILALRSLGMIEQNYLGNTKQAKDFYKKCLRLASKHNTHVLSAEIHRGLGSIYANQRKKDSNIHHLKKSIYLFNKFKMARGMISSKINLAASFTNGGDVPEAIKYLKEAETLCYEFDYEELLPYVYINMEVATPKDSIEEKIRILKKCILKGKEYKNNQVVHHSATNLGTVYGNNNQFLKAQQAFRDARKALSTLKFANAKYTFNRSFINFHNSWKKNKPVEFEQYAEKINYAKVLNETEAAFKKDNNYIELEYLYRTFVNYYKGKDIQQVAKYQDLLLFVKDSMNSLKSERANYKYLEDLKTAEQKNEIVKLEAQKEIDDLEKKQLLLGSLLSLLLLGLVGYYIYKRIKKRNAAEQAARALAMRHKLSNDLHDEVGSNLTGLVMLAEGISMSKNPPKESIDELASVSRNIMVTMRDTVWAIDSRKDSVEDLVYRMQDYAKNYFEETDIMAKLHHDIADEAKPLNSELRQNIYLLFKEALNNIVKHAKGDRATIDIIQNDKYFELKIHNNGPVPENIKTSGLGLASMRERAETFDGTFNINTDNGFTVEARFPI